MRPRSVKKDVRLQLYRLNVVISSDHPKGVISIGLRYCDRLAPAQLGKGFM
jgi:hypothetical protein